MSFHRPPTALLTDDDVAQRDAGAPFEPNSEAQARVHNSWAPTIGYSGRFGSAKSRTVSEGAFFDACVWPGNRVLLTRKRATDLFATTFQIFMEEVIPNELRARYRPGAQGGATLYLPNLSRVIFLGLDEPMKVKSGQYGSIYVDQAEDLDDDERRMAEGRLRHRLNTSWKNRKTGSADPESIGLPLRRRIVYAFNPDADSHWGNLTFGFKEMQRLPDSDPGHWFRQVFSKEKVTLLSGKVVPAGRLLLESVIAKPTDNTENLTEDYQLRLAGYSGPWRDRYVIGLWGSFEGQVLKNFREQIHVIDRPADWDMWGGYPPPTWTRYLVVDFGYGPGHPFVMQWLARRPATDEHPSADFLYQEIYMTGRLVSKHAEQAKKWNAEERDAINRGIERWNAEHTDKLEPRARLSFSMQVADHDAEDLATLESCGIVCDKAIKDRLPGAQLVYERIEQGRLWFVRTARREVDPELKSENRPTCTWEELSGLRWVKKPDSGDKPQKEDWVKVDDHGFDCLRYILLSERERGPMRITRVAAESRPRDATHGWAFNDD